jgi:2-oxo-4-hydroxy-4-carboxy-5-ureidoimidazoline decarboxylase
MSDSSIRPKLSEFLTWSPEEAAELLAGIYEHAPWVADKLASTAAAGKRPLWDSVSSMGELAEAMKSIVDDSPHSKQLTLLREYPDLSARVEALSNMTPPSQEEQTRAGLHTLTDEEGQKLTRLNDAYRTKYQFPFILAVRNATKYTVLSALNGRLSNAAHVEFAGALSQVHKIAWMRLLSAIDVDNRKGSLTCQVLDTANGCPGKRVQS